MVIYKKKSWKNNKSKKSTPTWNEKFQLPHRSYSVSDIQDYFEYIIKKHETVTDNPSIMIYVNKIDRILFWTFNAKDKNGENIPHLEITEAVLMYCNIVNYNYQQDLWVWHMFVPNKWFGQLLDSSANVIFLKIFNWDFSYIEVWFTDQILNR